MLTTITRQVLGGPGAVAAAGGGRPVAGAALAAGAGRAAVRLLGGHPLVRRLGRRRRWVLHYLTVLRSNAVPWGGCHIALDDLDEFPRPPSLSHTCNGVGG